MNVHNHRGRRIYPRQFLDRQNGLEEGAALAPELFRDFHGHQAQVEKFLQEIPAKDACIIHGAHVGSQTLQGKTAHRSLEQSLLFG